MLKVGSGGEVFRKRAEPMLVSLSDLYSVDEISVCLAILTLSTIVKCGLHQETKVYGNNSEVHKVCKLYA